VPSSPPGPSVAIVAAICGAEILGLAGFSIAPALLPRFIEAWSLTNTRAGWLAGMTSAGYMLVVIPLVSLTDRRPARQLYLASSVLSALSCFGMALCDSLLPAIGFRALAGIAMAGMSISRHTFERATGLTSSRKIPQAASRST
jgi:predicted MFS family arabinose efflux permease